MDPLPTLADGEDKTSAFKNCIRKNYRHVRKWAGRTQTNCFRIFDREIRHYPLAIDFYDGRFCIQYFSRKSEQEEAPQTLKHEVHNVLTSLFDLPLLQVYWRQRIKRAKQQQYEKLDESADFFTVLEYGVKFRVNLINYLDTGLFLDHRETRQLVAKAAKGKRLLNLFAYTASFSIHSAIAGATFTKSVDMSNTYTDWARENFKLNNLPLSQHAIVREDCLKFLQQELSTNARYDVIIMDPPTLSRSKKMDQMFDIQLDYIPLLGKALRLLGPGGILFFSTNSRDFRFDETAFPSHIIRNISAKTIPIDFHDPKIHHAWTFESKI